MSEESNLSHEYDPIKRREYYLKTRELAERNGTLNKSTKPRAKAVPKPAVKTRQQRQEERRRKIEAQVDALKGRLEKLRAVLAEMTKQAKLRSGQQPSKTPEKKASNQKTGAKQKLTASQKADAAKRSKENYEKNKDQLLADEVKSLTDKIKTIQERIAKMRKTSSVGAKNTQSK